MLPGKWGQRWQAQDIDTVIKVLVRSLGDTRVSVVIAPQQQRWLIGRQPHGGHGGGKNGNRVVFFLILCFLEQGAVGGFCHATLWAVNTAERLRGFFCRSTMGRSHITARLPNHLPSQKSPHLSGSDRAQYAHTHTSPCQTPQPHNWIYACSILCPTWQLCS